MACPTTTERAVAMVSGFVVAAMALAVMAGWLAGIRKLTHLNPSLPPMQFNTAVAFLLCSLGLFTLHHRSAYPVRFFGGAAALIGALTLLQYVLGIDIGLDAAIVDQTPDPNRMAPNTAITFTLIGTALVVAGMKRIGNAHLVAWALLCTIASTFGLASLVGYATQLDTAYGWSNFTRMAVHTSFGSVTLGISGLALACFASRRVAGKHPLRWLSLTTGVSVWMLTVLLWQALQAAHSDLKLDTDSSSIYSLLSWMVLAGGTVGAILISAVLAQTAFLRDELRIRRSVEARLREAMHEIQLQKYALDRHSIVAVTDPRGVITSVNDKFCSISGYSREELIGQTHRVVNSGTHPKSFFVELWRVISSGETWHGVICNRAKDGSLYWVATTIVPFIDSEGGITRYVSVRTDVTQQVLSELKIRNINTELRRKNAEMEQFTYTVSHDLKSPIVTIRGYTEYLKRDLSQERQDRVDGFVESILQATEKMRHTIDDLLELSRIGRMSHEMADCSLADVAETVVREMRPQIERIGAEVDIQPGLPSIQGDRFRLEQVFQNLLANAIKYARREDVALRVQIRWETRENMVRVRVADNGPGIDPAYREKVFGLFERLEPDMEGTGVGLSIVRRIADLHHGRAWIEETPGGGATFIIEFARDHADHDEFAELQMNEVMHT